MSEKSLSVVVLSLLVLGTWGSLAYGMWSGLMRTKHWPVYVAIPIMSSVDWFIVVSKAQAGSSIFALICVSFLFNYGLIMARRKARVEGQPHGPKDDIGPSR